MSEYIPFLAFWTGVVLIMHHFFGELGVGVVLVVASLLFACYNDLEGMEYE